MFPEVISINPLAPHEQCHTRDDVARVFRNLVGCLKFLEPMLDRGDITLRYDYAIEARCLIKGENLVASINHMPDAGDGADVKRLWFLMRARAEAVMNDTEAVVSYEAGSDMLNGHISQSMLNPDVYWASFGGKSIVEYHTLLVTRSSIGQITVANAHDRSSAMAFYPGYEHNEKHRQHTYTAANGEFVASMRVTPERAYQLLLISIPDGNRRWSYDTYTRSFIHFKVDGNKNVYHGFEDNEQVPQHLRNRLRQRA